MQTIGWDIILAEFLVEVDRPTFTLQPILETYSTLELARPFSGAVY